MREEKLQWLGIIRQQGKGIVVAKMALLPPRLGQIPDAVHMAREAGKTGTYASWCAWGEENVLVSTCVLFPQEEVAKFPAALKKIPGWERPTRAWRWCSPSDGRFQGTIVNLPIRDISVVESFYDRGMLIGVAKNRFFVTSLEIAEGTGYYTFVGIRLGATQENIPILAAMVDKWLMSPEKDGWKVHLQTDEKGEMDISALRVIIGDVDHPDHLAVPGSQFVEIPSPAGEIVSAGTDAAQNIKNDKVVQVNEKTEPGKVFAFVCALAQRPGIRVTIERRGEVFEPASPLLDIVRKTMEMYRQMAVKELPSFPGLEEVRTDEAPAENNGGQKQNTGH